MRKLETRAVRIPAYLLNQADVEGAHLSSLLDVLEGHSWTMWRPPVNAPGLLAFLLFSHLTEPEK